MPQPAAKKANFGFACPACGRRLQGTVGEMICCGVCHEYVRIPPKGQKADRELDQVLAFFASKPSESQKFEKAEAVFATHEHPFIEAWLLRLLETKPSLSGLRTPEQRSDERFRRRKAVEILQKSNSPAVLEAFLLSALRGDDDIETACVQYLAARKEKVAGQLVQALQEDDAVKRRRAAKILDRWKWQPTSDRERALHAWASGHFDRYDQPVDLASYGVAAVEFLLLELRDWVAAAHRDSQGKPRELKAAQAKWPQAKSTRTSINDSANRHAARRMSALTTLLDSAASQIDIEHLRELERFGSAIKWYSIVENLVHTDSYMNSDSGDYREASSYHDGWAIVEHVADFGRVSELARAELRRRGADKSPAPPAPKFVHVDDGTSFLVACPLCQSRFRLLREHAGKRMKCPKCGQSTLAVPT